MNKSEAINHVIQTLEQVKFKSGVIDPKTGEDTGETTQKVFLQQMKTIIFGKTGGVIYKMKPAADFYAEFVKATADPKLTPNECALYFLAIIKEVQNSTLRTCKSVVPENFHSGIDDLFNMNPRKQ